MTVDIYDEAGSLDYDKAREAVKASSHVSNDAIRSRQLDEIATAAVIDIAASLNIVALEASLAIGPLDTDNVSQLYGLTDRDGSDTGVTEDEVDEATRDFLVVTDLVHVVGDTEPGEVVGLGFDQGETYADRAVDEALTATDAGIGRHQQQGRDLAGAARHRRTADRRSANRRRS